MKVQAKRILPLLLFLSLDLQSYQKFGQKNVKWDPLVQAGFEALEGGNLPAGFNFLKRAHLAGCKDGLVLYKLGVYFELNKDFNGALNFFKEARPHLEKRYAAHPSTLGLTEHIADIHFQLNQWDLALKEYLSVIEKRGGNFQRLFLVGQIYRMKGNIPEATAAFEKSLNAPLPEGLAPQTRLMAMIELVKLYANAKEEDKALILCDQILNLDPTNRTALTLKDNILHRRTQQKQREKWKEILEKY